MPTIRYTVRAECPDAATRDDFVAWLADGHVRAVLDGGATSAAVVTLDDDASNAPPGTPVVIIEYAFPSRQAYERYEREHAPSLRREGREMFVEGRGVTMSRTLGVVARSWE
ncbi:MAG: DUF4286 family protein [Phycisphaerales bacterium]